MPYGRRVADAAMLLACRGGTMSLAVAQRINRMVRVVSVLSFLAASSIACAIPIPPGTTAADDLIINFDFSTPPASPAPPYSEMITTLSASSTPSLAAVLDIYGDL